MAENFTVAIDRIQSVLNAVRKVIRYASDSEREEFLEELRELVKSHPVVIPHPSKKKKY